MAAIEFAALRIAGRMARPLVFQLGEDQFSLHINKVDRTKLYGSKEVEVLDDHDQQCELATLADDGHTIIGRGDTGLMWIDADGKCCDKSALKPVDVHGEAIKPVASSFGATIELFETVSVEEYLDHNIRLIYEVEAATDGDDLTVLMQHLAKGAIFAFPYSYRGGLEADTGFLLTNDSGVIMMVVGNKIHATYASVQSQIALAEMEETADDEGVDSLNFDMI